jgi:peptide/nickel transport system permease protein
MSDGRGAPLAALGRAMHGAAPRLALALLGAVLLAVIAAPMLAPAPPSVMSNIIVDRALAPSLAHPFGTDSYSRDVLSRVLYGGRVSLTVAALSVFVAVTLGVLWGAIAGAAGSLVDATMMRLTDVLLGMPRIVLLLAIVATTGPLSPIRIALLLGFTGWAAMSRLVRSEVRALSQREYVIAARALGVTEWRIVRTHLLPAVAPQVIVAATLALASVIPLEASLSFIGLGVQSPTPSWGNIILEGADRPVDLWWLIACPALAIIITVTAVNVLGERLREAVDPRQRILR